MANSHSNPLVRFFQWIAGAFRSLFGIEKPDTNRPKATQVTIREEDPGQNDIVVFFDGPVGNYVAGSILLGNPYCRLVELQAESPDATALFSSNFDPADFGLRDTAIDVVLFDENQYLVSENQVFGGSLPVPNTLKVFRNASGVTKNITVIFNQEMESYGNSFWNMQVLDSDTYEESTLQNLGKVESSPSSLTAENWTTGSGQINWDSITENTPLEVRITNQNVGSIATHSQAVTVEIHPHEHIDDDIIYKEKPKATQVTVREVDPLVNDADTGIDIHFDNDPSGYTSGSITLGNPVEATLTDLRYDAASPNILTAWSCDPADYEPDFGVAIDVKLYDTGSPQGDPDSEQSVILGEPPIPNGFTVDMNGSEVSSITITFNIDPTTFGNSDWALHVVSDIEGDNGEKKRNLIADLAPGEAGQNQLLSTSDPVAYGIYESFPWEDLQDNPQVSIRLGNRNAWNDVQGGWTQLQSVVNQE